MPEVVEDFLDVGDQSGQNYVLLSFVFLNL